MFLNLHGKRFINLVGKVSCCQIRIWGLDLYQKLIGVLT